MLGHDLRQVMRLLRRKPVFVLTIILTLALGVGVNTALFSVVSSVLLRPLPVENPEQLVVLAAKTAGAPDYSNLSLAELQDVQSQAGDLELAGHWTTMFGLSSRGRPERVLVVFVTGNFFSLLGVQPVEGRLITPAEGNGLGADPVVVLGHRYWRQRFNGDASIVGNTVVANGQALTVVGIAPPEFHGVNALVEPDVYMPVSMAIIRPVLSADPREFWTSRRARSMQVIGRLRPGVEIDQAQASLSVIAQRLERDHVETNKGVTLRLFEERDARPQPLDSNPLPIVGSLFLLLVGTVLVVACVNVANLLLVRALGAEREIAVRVALGAGRAPLIRQSITESIVLALFGGAVGVALGKYACDGLEAMSRQTDFPFYLDFTLDWRVFTYALGLTVLAGIFVGLMPVMRASRANVSAILHEGGRSNTIAPWRRRVQNALVVGQIAGSLVLLVTAGLFVRSLQHVERMDLGFDPDRLVNLTMDTHLLGYDEVSSRTFYRTLTTVVRGLPRVESASLSHTIPFGYVHAQAKVYPAGQPLAGSDEQAPDIYYNVVDYAYFDNLRISILKGRAFREADTADTPPVAIVNETMARRFWPDEDPIGKRFSTGSRTEPPVEIVGVVRDGRYIEPTDESVPYFFRPLAQAHTSYLTLQIRTTELPRRMIQEVDGVVRSLASEMPTWDVGTMRSALNGVNGLFFFRVGAALGMALGALALILAAVGLYGVVTYSVSQRSEEIGVRVALGAQRSHILRLILKQGLVIVTLGTAGGLLVAFVVGQIMESLLVGIGPYDLVTFAGMSGLLIVVAAIANLVPALRALRVDPNVALRSE